MPPRVSCLALQFSTCETGYRIAVSLPAFAASKTSSTRASSNWPGNTRSTLALQFCAINSRQVCCGEPCINPIGHSSGLCGAALLVPGPVEPWEQRLDVGRLYGGSAPDAQAGGRWAVACKFVGRAFLLEPPGHRPHGLKAVLGGEPGEPRLGDLELRRGAGNRGRVLGERIGPGAFLDPGKKCRQVAFRPGDQPIEAADRLRPFE